jgi:hypothetical protein
MMDSGLAPSARPAACESNLANATGRRVEEILTLGFVWVPRRRGAANRADRSPPR